MDYFEVLWAPVEYSDMPGVIKNRPILRIAETRFNSVKPEDWLNTFKMTSKPPRGGRYIEYSLIYWREAGLAKPSTVRLSSKPIQMPKRVVTRKLGDLSRVDALKISKIIKDKARRIGIYP